MDFRVDIKDPAIADLAEIVSYVAQDNPDVARVLGNHLLDAALSLAETPHKGSPYRKLLNVSGDQHLCRLSVRPFAGARDRILASIARGWYGRFLRIRRSPRTGIDLERTQLGSHVEASFR